MENTINLNVVDVNSIQLEFDSLKKALVKNNYTESEKDDLVFYFIMHCRKLVSMIRDFPEQFETIKQIREIEAKALEQWPTIKLDLLKRR